MLTCHKSEEEVHGNKPYLAFLKEMVAFIQSLFLMQKGITLRKVIRGKVRPESVVITDGWRGYSGLLDVGYEKHFRIDKSRSFSNKNGVHINGIELRSTSRIPIRNK